MGGDLVMITRPCYANRDVVKRALDLDLTGIDDARIDRALASVSETIDGHLHRYFYPLDATMYLDWPNFQYASPWRFWFDQPGGHDLWVMTQLQSPGGTGGTQVPLWQVFLEPVNRKQGWPFTRMELDRSTMAAWGAAATPQHSIWVTGTWGWYSPVPAGTLASPAAAPDVTVTVSDGSQFGAGDVLLLEPGYGPAPFPAYPGTAGALAPVLGERCIVTGKMSSATGLTQSGAGCSTASSSDNLLTVTGSGQLNAGEVVTLDAEQMLVMTVSGATATVKRAWNGTVLATHTAAAVFAGRALQVLRGQLGTAAAAHPSGAVIARHQPPQLVADLCIAECENRVLQETSGYARTVGEGETAHPAPGAGLADLWDEAESVFGRHARIRAV